MSVASSHHDRRNPERARVPFEALVEIAAPEGASFEAESIDLSSSGMHLKTAYLPAVGTPLMFRFEAEAQGAPILAKGEVVWAQDGPEGSEFGVRFADIKADGADAIRALIGAAMERELDQPPPGPRLQKNDRSPATLAGVGPSELGIPSALIPRGAPVRIHIEGVASPMRATLRDDARKGAVVGSELKMLKIGAVVELEDKERRTRRSARVEDVDCEVDESSRIPQLVVKLRYDVETPEGAFMDTKKVDPMAIEDAAREIRTATMPPPPEAAVGAPVERSSQARVALPIAESESASNSGKFEVVADGMKKMSSVMKDAFSATSAAASRLGARAKTTVQLLSNRKDDGKGDDGDMRRTTSPAPGHTSKPRTLRPQGASRDFVHGEGSEEVMQEIDTKKVARRRQMGIIAGIGLALVLAFFAFRKPKHQPVANAPAPELAPAPPPPAMMTTPAQADTNVAAIPPPPVAPLAGDPTGVDAKGNPNPFGTTSVKKGTRMVLRLDGPITELRGATTPNGFVVAVPNRKSLEAAGPLAAKDPRIAAAKVVNQGGGAELTISFKDSTPSYLVKAKGDSIEIVLAKDKAIAKKPKGGNKGGKSGKPAGKKH